MTTKARVFAGVCGFTSVIKAQATGKMRVKLQIITACQAVKSMNEDLADLDCTKGVFCRICDSVVYQSAHRRLKHTDCPVPSAILKAVQVEIGGALPRGVQMQIEVLEEEEEAPE